MKEYVDIEGSGENTTTISGVSDVVLGASNAELRFLTVSSNGGSGSGGACITNINTSPKISNVTVKNSGTGGYDSGIFSSGGSPELINVTINARTGVNTSNVINCRIKQMYINASHQGIKFEGTGTSLLVADSIIEATGYGIFSNAAQSSFLAITNVSITAPTGIYVYQLSTSTATIDNSSINSANETIRVDSAYNMKIYIGNSKLAGGPAPTSISVICAGVYDENYVFYQDTCPQ